MSRAPVPPAIQHHSLHQSHPKTHKPSASPPSTMAETQTAPSFPPPHLLDFSQRRLPQIQLPPLMIPPSSQQQQNHYYQNQPQQNQHQQPQPQHPQQPYHQHHQSLPSIHNPPAPGSSASRSQPKPYRAAPLDNLLLSPNNPYTPPRSEPTYSPRSPPRSAIDRFPPRRSDEKYNLQHESGPAQPATSYLSPVDAHPHLRHQSYSSLPSPASSYPPSYHSSGSVPAPPPYRSTPQPSSSGNSPPSQHPPPAPAPYPMQPQSQYPEHPSTLPPRHISAAPPPPPTSAPKTEKRYPMSPVAAAASPIHPSHPPPPHPSSYTSHPSPHMSHPPPPHHGHPGPPPHAPTSHPNPGAQAHGASMPPNVSQSDLQYKLIIRQQPIAARACGFGERDRRVIDPPPIIQLEVKDPQTGGVDMDELKYSFNLVHCTLWNADGSAEETALVQPDRRTTRRLMGQLVASPSVAKDEHDVEGCFFCFPDLSCRTHGKYRLRFVLMRVDPAHLVVGGFSPILTEVLSDVFTVYTAKDFPGMRPSSALTRALKLQGCNIQVKKGNEKALGRRRERESQRNSMGDAADVPNGRSRGSSEDEEDGRRKRRREV